MDLKKIIFTFFSVFLLAFAVTVITTYLYSQIVHKAGMANWELAIILGIILGVVKAFDNKKK
ncbi:MAG: hypothetical protein ABFR75_07690 [Acidobacteriota bacterium]